ncbi:MAG: sigma-54-dependent transcriptional regulator [Desulfuromonas sp.]
MAQILIVDDEDRIRDLLSLMLAGAGHQTHQAGSGRQALDVLDRHDVDLVISDVRMDQLDGFGLLSALRERELDCPLIFITAFATLESAIEALRLGAADYLIKPFETNAVLLAVERALGMKKLLDENRSLRRRLDQNPPETEGVFASAAMQQVRQLADRVALSDATVLLTGESGTGKEVLARHIHCHSPRASEPFVAINCAALAASLLEAELFGHEKGAFTGADKARAGKFEYAAGGTLFLDEIGEMTPEAQAKLLRALQEKTIQRLGGNRDIAVHCRLVCATNRDLLEQVGQGAFREDLYYRLSVFPIELPPLRQRPDDILPLAYHYLRRRLSLKMTDNPFTATAAQILRHHPWPGNVRELFNVLERALILKGNAIPFEENDFQALTASNRAGQGRATEEPFRLPPDGINYDALQRSIVRQALRHTRGNQSAAARLLGLSRTRLRTLVAQLDGAATEAP